MRAHHSLIGLLGLTGAVFALGGFGGGTAAATSNECEEARPAALNVIERGRYLVRISGCNDCHTPGWPESGGTLPERKWLTGSSVGWNGPWGTSYAINLREFVSTISEKAWIERARQVEGRPPMPWFALRAMNEDDLRGIYRFIRHLGPAGSPAPASIPPGAKPKTPYVVFVPQVPR
jgi:mono/diheme cytochrome c family protein